MPIDLHTLYFLLVGTLTVAAAMLLWEREAHPHRARQLDVWIGGTLLFIVATVVAINRTSFPGVLGSAVSNLLFLSGYLAWLHGARRLEGAAGMRWYAVLLGVIAALWVIGADAFPKALWNHIAAVPIAAISGLTALTLWRARPVQRLRSRPIAVAIPTAHAVFYLGRAFVIPALVALFETDIVAATAKLTMYEAVLFSVAMPMAFVSLVREEAQDRLRAAAHTDYLTGLSNRHGFFEVGGRALAEGKDGTPVSLLAFDLDHFKTINDRYGHAAGDTVLRLFAAIASELTRDAGDPDAIVARLGGEEFAALLPGRSLVEARAIGEQVAARFAQASAGGIAATVSVGLAEARPDGRDLGKLLAHADKALYRAKSLGRNRVEVAGQAVA